MGRQALFAIFFSGVFFGLYFGKCFFFSIFLAPRLKVVKGSGLQVSDLRLAMSEP